MESLHSTALTPLLTLLLVVTAFHAGPCLCRQWMSIRISDEVTAEHELDMASLKALVASDSGPVEVVYAFGTTARRTITHVASPQDTGRGTCA